jgi:hypothetical protein
VEKDFKDYLIRELGYLRESMDDIRDTCVKRDEYDTNKRTVTGWIIGVLTLFTTVSIGLVTLIFK